MTAVWVCPAPSWAVSPSPAFPRRWFASPSSCRGGAKRSRLSSSVPWRERRRHMTAWSWKLGRVAGIDVYMHGTFLILLAWVGVSHYLQRHELADAAAGILFI